MSHSQVLLGEDHLVNELQPELEPSKNLVKGNINIIGTDQITMTADGFLFSKLKTRAKKEVARATRVDQGTFPRYWVQNTLKIIL